MPRYLETAELLRKEVKSFMENNPIPILAAVQLGHIVNLAVRCSPRGVQGTVRKNIVATAMRGYCSVSMARETDPKTDREYNKISILPKGA